MGEINYNSSLNRQAAEYYGHREDFQQIVHRVGSPDNQAKLLDQIEIEIARDEQCLHLKHRLQLLKSISFVLTLLLPIPVLLCLLKVLSLPWTVAALGGIYACARYVGVLAARRRNAYESRLKSEKAKHAAALKMAEDRDAWLKNRIEEEWDVYCIGFVDYPPDWKFRVILVLERDGHKCTRCGWPSGFKRKVRELHVHHVLRHSRGGNHSLSNLVTLCDICHRSQDGPGHNRIRPRSRKSRRR